MFMPKMNSINRGREKTNRILKGLIYLKSKIKPICCSDEVIKFINKNNKPSHINVQMTKGVEGMRYIKN